MISGLNHITLATAGLDRAISFYQDTLGMQLVKRFDNGAYFSAGALWLCLSLDATAKPSTDYTHVAFDIAEEDFSAMTNRINAAHATQWKINRSEGDSMYFNDPDGHRLELHVGTLETRLNAMNVEASRC